MLGAMKLTTSERMELQRQASVRKERADAARLLTRLKPCCCRPDVQNTMGSSTSGTAHCRFAPHSIPRLARCGAKLQRVTRRLSSWLS